MPIFVKGRIRCLYVHIPKAGGTSLKQSLRRHGWEEQLSVRGQPVQALQHLRCSPQHYHRELLEQLLRLEAFDLAFTVCRHPFSRMKSEYYWQRDNGLAPSLDPHAWFEAVLAAYAHDPYVYDNHLRPQQDFILAQPGFKVFKVEEDGVRQALARTDALAPASPLQRLADALRPARAHRSTPSPQVEAAFAALRPRIEAFYAQDMARFGY